MVNRYLSLIALAFVTLQSMAQQKFMYQGNTLTTGASVYLVDPMKTASNIEHVYNKVSDAITAAQEQKNREKGTLDIYIAPSVYWMDNPDDQSIAHRVSPTIPAIGTRVNLSKVRLIGLSDSPENTVICTNRGESFGADTQYEMFFWIGDDITMENLTFGNFCTIDLQYPLKPELSRKRRTNVLTRSSIGMVKGDKYYFKNCKFVGRAAMSPFVGADRTLYDNCTMECSENGLNPTAVYLNCKLYLYSDKPLHSTIGSGVVFLNCDFYAIMKKQYISRAGGSIAMVDCRWDNISKDAIYNWSLKPIIDERNYVYNVTTIENKPIVWQTKYPQITVDMTGKPILSAYKNADGSYNVYNLVCGSDGWNPQQISTAKSHREATMLTLTQRNITIESLVDEYKLRAKEYCYADPETSLAPQPITWTVADEKDKNTLSLESSDNGKICIVRGLTTDDDEHEAFITANTPQGLCSACRVTLIPKQMPAPTFAENPKLVVNDAARNITIDYKLNLEGTLRDESVINWYRSAKSDTTKWYPILCSHKGTLKTYPTSDADNGCYVKAIIATKHQRCIPNDSTVSVITAAPIKSNYHIKELYTDFTTINGKVQPFIEKGLWTFDIYHPIDTRGIKWPVEKQDDNVYVYGEGIDGAVGYTGFYQAHRGARMLYTPTGDKYSDMEISMDVAPFKNAGQGFGGTNQQYMDIFIKYDTKTQTGYALRIIRTKKFNGAVDFVLMHYTNGIGKELCDPVSATAFRHGCSIHVKIAGKQFTAEVTNPDKGDPLDVGVPINAELSTEIAPNNYGGFGIQHTGMVANAACLLQNMKVTWK